MMRLIVTGHKNHGKDTFCDFLNLPWQSTSQYACKAFIFHQLKNRYNYKTADQCYRDRNNHRQTWYDLIRTYNKDNETKLAQSIFNEVPVLNGIRSVAELNACKEQGLVDLVIWVDASKRLPPEPPTSMTVEATDCDIIVTNNDTLDDLKRKATALNKLLIGNTQ